MKQLKAFIFVLFIFTCFNAAFADPEPQTPAADASLTALTTKGYVDAGLKAVWKKAKDADVENANTATYDSNTNYTAGTVGAAIKSIEGDLDNVVDAVDELEDRVDDLEASVTYESGVGITVDNENRTVGLKGVTAQELANKTYVLKNGQWQELEVEDSWDPNILN